MKHSNLLPKNNKMPIIRIAPVCNGKIYVVSPHSVMEDESSRMDLPMEECVRHVSANSDKEARKIKEKYHQHLQTDASPRFCVKHHSSKEKGTTIYLYVLPLKSEDEIRFREGKFVTSEDISKNPGVYSPDLQTENELLGMAAELWNDFYSL